MLHRKPPRHRAARRLGRRALVVGCTALLAGVPAGAEPPAGARLELTAPLVEPVTVEAREALRRALRPLTVVVRRKGALPPGMWAPGGLESEGHGFWAGPGRVVTAAVAVEGWPKSASDTIEVELHDGRRFEAAVGLTEAALGLAVLDVPTLSAPPSSPPLGGRDEAVRAGWPLYAADGSGMLHRLIVGRAGEGQLAYYRHLTGHPAVGTPLFDGTGRLVSLVGRADPEGVAALALPAKALRALLERDGWRR